MESAKIIKLLRQYAFPITNEKEVQEDIYKVLTEYGNYQVEKEYRLDAKSIPDFFIDGVAIEVKIKGRRVKILEQCERYCSYDEVKSLILVTSRFTGFPQYINDKPVFVVNLSRGLL